MDVDFYPDAPLEDHIAILRFLENGNDAAIRILSSKKAGFSVCDIDELETINPTEKDSIMGYVLSGNYKFVRFSVMCEIKQALQFKSGDYILIAKELKIKGYSIKTISL